MQSSEYCLAAALISSSILLARFQPLLQLLWASNCSRPTKFSWLMPRRMATREEHKKRLTKSGAARST
jgi:hypothetical protein